jgi:hypothetical protein
VIALREGGARETVLEGETGTFFEVPAPEALAATVARFDTLDVDPADCVRNAHRFDVSVFRQEMRDVVDDALHGERAPREDRRRRVPRGLALAS